MGFLGVWDLFIGALSVGLAAPVIKRLVDSQLPTKWLVIMTTVFDDTDALLTSCVEQGLIKEPLAALFHSQIESLRQRALVARLQALGAKDYYEDIKNMCGGLSFRIREVCNDVRELRAEISTTSLREKERLAAEQCHTGGVSPVANYDTRAPQLTTHATQSSGAAVASIPPVSTTSGVEPAGTAPPAQMEQHAGTAEHSSADHQPPDAGAPHLDEHSSTASTWSSRGRRQGALQARVHAQLLVHFVRKVRARDDRRASRRGAQDETTSIELSDTSSETLVEDAGDSEWETDHEDDRQQAVPSMPLTDAVKS